MTLSRLASPPVPSPRDGHARLDHGALVGGPAEVTVGQAVRSRSRPRPVVPSRLLLPDLDEQWLVDTLERHLET